MMKVAHLTFTYELRAKVDDSEQGYSLVVVNININTIITQRITIIELRLMC